MDLHPILNRKRVRPRPLIASVLLLVATGAVYSLSTEQKLVLALAAGGLQLGAFVLLAVALRLARGFAFAAGLLSIGISVGAYLEEPSAMVFTTIGAMAVAGLTGFITSSQRTDSEDHIPDK